MAWSPRPECSGRSARSTNYDAAEFLRVIEINLSVRLWPSTTACLPSAPPTRGADRHLQRRRRHRPLPRYDAYAASKAAVVRLTENWARDLARRRNPSQRRRAGIRRHPDP